jgi:hypothetical protein
MWEGCFVEAAWKAEIDSFAVLVASDRVAAKAAGIAIPVTIVEEDCRKGLFLDAQGKNPPQLRSGAGNVRLRKQF